MNCEYCGDPLVDGGLDYYCPKDKCFKLNLKRCIEMLNKNEEKYEEALYLKLKAKYDPS